MHFMYGTRKWIQLLKKYREQFPNTNLLDRQTILSFIQIDHFMLLGVILSFKDIVEFLQWKKILKTVQDNHSSSSKAVERALRGIHATVLRTLHEVLFPISLSMSASNDAPDDYHPHLNFAC